MNCDWVEEHLHRILDHEITPAEEAALDEHVSECGQCAECLRDAAAEEDLLRAAAAHPAAPAELASSVMGRLDQLPRQRPRRIRLWVPLATAAALLVTASVAHRRLTDIRPPVVGWPAVATLVHGEGTIMKMGQGSEGWEPVVTGERLLQGDRLKTGERGKADIAFGDRAKLKLNGNGIARLGKSIVFLESGRAFAWVDKANVKFTIASPQARAVVRGTQFNVDCRAEGSTVLSVVEGVVAFGNRFGSIEVKADMRSDAKADEEPSPALYTDLWDDVAWAGIDESTINLPVDVRFRVDPEADDGVFSERTPTFAVHLGYGDTRYATLWLRCQVTDADGNTAVETKERVCMRAYRYRTKKMSIPHLSPGSYRARFRIGHGRYAVVQTAEFVVK